MYQLNDILGSSTGYRMLKFFAKNPNEEFYRSQLKEKLGMAKATVGKWLKALENERIITSKEKSNAKFYKLNKESSIVKQTKILISLEEIIPLFNDFSKEAYIYGSVARGEDTRKSDIDLLVITNEEEKKVIEEVNEVSKKIERDIKPTIFTPLEFSKLAKEDKAFYERINRDKIKISDEDEH